MSLVTALLEKQPFEPMSGTVYVHSIDNRKQGDEARSIETDQHAVMTAIGDNEKTVLQLMEDTRLSEGTVRRILQSLINLHKATEGTRTGSTKRYKRREESGS